MDILDSRKQHFIEDLALWRHTLEGVDHAVLPPETSRPNPLVVEDLVIASVFSPGGIYAVDRATGQQRWTLPTNGLAGSPVTYAEGTLYGKSVHTLYAIDPLSGHVRWTFCPYGTDHEWIYSSPTVNEGRLFLGDRAGYLNCLDATSGEVIWRKQTSRSRRCQVNATAVVLGDLVIVATIVNSAVAYETATGRLVWRQRLDGPSSSELLSWKDRVLVQTRKSLYLLNPKSGEILHHWNWRGKEVRAVAVGGDVLLVIIEQKDAPTSNHAKDTIQSKMEIKGFREDKVIFEGLTSRYVQGIRWSQETGLFYECRSDDLYILETETGRRIHDIRSKERLLYPGLPDVKDGVIYMLAEDKALYAIRHP